MHLGVLVLAGLATASSAIAAPTVLAPHRAVYNVTLAESQATAGVADLTGRLVYELQGTSCEGFTQTMRFVTRTANSEGRTAVSDMRSRFEEDIEANTFAFQTQNYRNRRLTERAVGTAARTDAANVKVSIEQPGRRTVEFDKDIKFPIGHAVALIEAARAGRSIYTTYLYDGAEKGDKLFSTTAAIGGPVSSDAKAALSEAPGADVLNVLTAWPISMSYFELDALETDGVPVYELAFMMFENGVSRRLYIDYGTFAIRGTLQSLEMLPSKPCP